MKHPFDAASDLLKSWQPTSNASKSPKATGIPASFVFDRKTSSGKDIYSDPNHPSHANFTAKDHSEAYYAHQKHLNDLRTSHKTPSKELIEHHEKAKTYHRQQHDRLTTKS